jgi:CheY-like chemotaxis protein
MSQHRPKILVIDDTPTDLLMLGAALSADFDLQTATSGPLGLALAQKSPPDLILLDVMMLGMDGYETCQRLKSDAQLKDLISKILQLAL